MRRFILIGLYVFAFVLIVATSRKNPMIEPPLTSPRDKSVEIFAPGRVEGVSEEIELFASVRERISSIHVKESDWVRQGEVLIQQDNSTQLAEVELAKAGIQQAKAELDRLRNGARKSEIDEARHHCDVRKTELALAIRQQERGRLLVPSSAISREEMESLESKAQSAQAYWEAAEDRFATISLPPRVEDLEAAQAKLDACVAQLQLAEAILAKTQIKAPRNAQVLQINVQEGELPAEKPLLILCDTERLFVRASIDEFDALCVQIGQSVKISANALANRTLQGTVSRLRPRMDRKELDSDRPDVRLDTRSREIWIQVHHDAPLLIGMPVELWIEKRNQSNPDPVAKTADRRK